MKKTISTALSFGATVSAIKLTAQHHETDYEEGYDSTLPVDTTLPECTEDPCPEDDGSIVTIMPVDTWDGNDSTKPECTEDPCPEEEIHEAPVKDAINFFDLFDAQKEEVPSISFPSFNATNSTNSTNSTDYGSAKKSEGLFDLLMDKYASYNATNSTNSTDDGSAKYASYNATNSTNSTNSTDDGSAKKSEGLFDLPKEDDTKPDPPQEEPVEETAAKEEEAPVEEKAAEEDDADLYDKDAAVVDYKVPQDTTSTMLGLNQDNVLMSWLHHGQVEDRDDWLALDGYYYNRIPATDEAQSQCTIQSRSESKKIEVPSAKKVGYRPIDACQDDSNGMPTYLKRFQMSERTDQPWDAKDVIGFECCTLPVYEGYDVKKTHSKIIDVRKPFDFGLPKDVKGGWWGYYTSYKPWSGCPDDMFLDGIHGVKLNGDQSVSQVEYLSCKGPVEN